MFPLPQTILQANNGMRNLAAVGLAAVVALSLFWLMHYLILGSEREMRRADAYRTVDFVRLKRDERLETRQRTRPEKPPPPKQPPPPPKLQVQAPTPQQQAPTPFNIPNLNIPTNITGGPFLGTFSAADHGDGELIPMVRLAPQYPRQALRDGIEGYVDLEIVVNPDGTVREARVRDARPRGYFESAAVNAALRGKFRPRVVDGQPVESRGSYRMVFSLAD
jgi:periplasmic protein TonB